MALSAAPKLTVSPMNTATPKAPVIIKKYANRRLYDTGSSAYVTLETLAKMVKDGIDFCVYDAKTSEDITRSVLTQIIVEEEGKSGQQCLLPISFLRQLIGFYGDNMQWLVPKYLEHSMETLAKNQDQIANYMQTAFGGMFPFGTALEEMGKKNIEMFERTMRMFAPFIAAAQDQDKQDQDKTDERSDAASVTNIPLRSTSGAPAATTPAAQTKATVTSIPTSASPSSRSTPSPLASETKSCATPCCATETLAKTCQPSAQPAVAQPAATQPLEKPPESIKDTTKNPAKDTTGLLETAATKMEAAKPSPALTQAPMAELSPPPAWPQIAPAAAKPAMDQTVPAQTAPATTTGRQDPEAASPAPAMREIGAMGMMTATMPMTNVQTAAAASAIPSTEDMQQKIANLQRQLAELAKNRS